MYKLIIIIYLLFISDISYAKDNIKICLTGKIVKIIPSYGESFTNAALLAKEENGIKNKIEIKSYLFENKPLEAISVYNQMIQDKCSAIIGYEYLSDLLLISKIQTDTKIPIITSYSSKNKSDNYPKNIFILMPNYDYLSNKMFNFLIKKYNKINNVLVISDISRSEMIKYKTSYTDIFKKRNINYDIFDFLESDFNAEKKLKDFIQEKSYNYIFLLSGASSSSKIIQILNNHKTIFIGTENFGSSVNQTLFDFLRDKEINAYFSRNLDFLKSNKKLNKFQIAYFKRFKKNPTILSAYTYDATKIILEVINQKLKLSSENIYKINYNGVTGIKIINNHFNSSTNYSILKINKTGYSIEE